MRAVDFIRFNRYLLRSSRLAINPVASVRRAIAIARAHPAPTGGLPSAHVHVVAPNGLAPTNVGARPSARTQKAKESPRLERL